MGDHNTTTDPPHVSVVMAARDAAGSIAAAVESIFSQTYAGPLDLTVAVPATDHDTRRVIDTLHTGDDRFRIVDNPSGTTPSGLNRAIEASDGSIVVRCDAHAVLPRDYIETAVRVLNETGAANVGGIQAAEGTTVFSRAVAIAMTSRFGVGGASFHYGGEPGPVDTVYLGVFDRTRLEAVGGYDEAYIRNQDYELNHRLRSAGHDVYFTPELRVRYAPRDSAPGLARQYFDYGRWKRFMLSRNPDAIRLRQLAPPLLVSGLVLSAVAALTPLRAVSWWLPAVYAAFLVAATVKAAFAHRDAAALLQPVVLPIMHLAWGTGYWLGRSSTP